jgi:hypothetical protein
MKVFPFLTAALLAGLPLQAQTPAPPTPPAEAGAAPAKRSLLKYSAPKTGGGGARIDGDGGSRGLSDKIKLPPIYVLVPDSAALTTEESPTLFWYQSAPADLRFEFTLTEPKNPKPVLKLAVVKAPQAGIHRISLGKQGVQLKTGVTYKWTVAWVPDQNNRSLNVIAGGSIERVEPDAKLTAALEGAHGADLAGVYARNGIWYDALESISNAIEAAPDDKSLQNERADLLDQAGLKNVAAAERH